MRDHLLSEGALGLSMLPFVEAVVELVAHPLGGVPRTGDTAHELVIADRVIALLADAAAADEATNAAAVDRLAADDEMLSGFFQSLDLLPGGGGTADAVALLVVSAIGRLGE